MTSLPLWLCVVAVAMSAFLWAVLYCASSKSNDWLDILSVGILGTSVFGLPGLLLLAPECVKGF
jgi:hypothetical protein